MPTDEQCRAYAAEYQRLGQEAILIQSALRIWNWKDDARQRSGPQRQCKSSRYAARDPTRSLWDRCLLSPTGRAVRHSPRVRKPMLKPLG